MNQSQHGEFFPWNNLSLRIWLQEVKIESLHLIVGLRADGCMYVKAPDRHQSMEGFLNDKRWNIVQEDFITVQVQKVATSHGETHDYYTGEITSAEVTLKLTFLPTSDPERSKAQEAAFTPTAPVRAARWGEWHPQIQPPYLVGARLIDQVPASTTLSVQVPTTARGSEGELDMTTLPRAFDRFPVRIARNYVFQGRALTQYTHVESPAQLVARAGRWAKGDEFIAYYLNRPLTVDTSGVKKVEAVPAIAATLKRLETEEPLLYKFFLTLHDSRTFEKTSNNRLLAATLTEIGSDYDTLKDALKAQMDRVFKTQHEARDWTGTDPYRSRYEPFGYGRFVCQALPGAKDKIEADKAKSQWQFAKSVRTKAEVLGISPTHHPNLLARVASNAFPLSLFHERGYEDKLINVEFDLWEKALSRKGWGDVISQIAASASTRSTFSKRITSYFAFLFRIEKYLDRNAPRKGGKKAGWKAMPKFVNSQWELEMDETTEEGTTKRRSALTPVADNETGVVTVPYASLRVSGVQTTYCYSEVYFVAEEGAEDPIFEAGGVYTSDVKEKLNGRDDYGLCFYTLTGTTRNQGYPTFLVIFERTNAHGTRVHFHRVHPSRSRGPNGTATPPDRLIEECYRYMAGNVRAEEIKHQQGDLLLIPVEEPGKAVAEPVVVRGFENHTFESKGERPVQLFKTTAKAAGNLLGYLSAPDGMRMPHPEHEPIEDIAPGVYALRRAKSWEANPTSVWVLNID